MMYINCNGIKTKQNNKSLLCLNPLRAQLGRRAWVPPRKCCSSTLRNARIFLRPVLESLGWEQPIAAEFGVPKLHRKKIIACAKKVRVFGRVVITFLFHTLTPCFYALSDLLWYSGRSKDAPRPTCVFPDVFSFQLAARCKTPACMWRWEGKEKNQRVSATPDQNNCRIFNCIFVYSARYTRGRFAMQFGWKLH